MTTLKDFSSYLFKQYKNFRKEVPSMEKGHNFTDNLINFLFPVKAERRCTKPQIELNMAQLQIDFKDLLSPLNKDLNEPVDIMSEKFYNEIPSIYEIHLK